MTSSFMFFFKQLREMNEEIENEKQKLLAAQQKQSSSETSQGNKKVWREEEIQMLIKGVNLFPAGTKERSGRLHLKGLLILVNILLPVFV